MARQRMNETLRQPISSDRVRAILADAGETEELEEFDATASYELCRDDVDEYIRIAPAGPIIITNDTDANPSPWGQWEKEPVRTLDDARAEILGDRWDPSNSDADEAIFGPH